MNTTFRLAMRLEGEFWNAYLASDNTMADAVLLGSIRLTAIHDNPELKIRFMDLMKEILSSALWDVAGLTLSWSNSPQSAPEHERGGAA